MRAPARTKWPHLRPAPPAASYVQQEMVALPGRDHPEEGLHLVPLDRLVEAAELGPEHGGDLRAFLEEIERGEQVARQRARPVIGLARDRLARLQLRLHPEIAAGER